MNRFLKYFLPITAGVGFIAIIFYLMKPLPVTRENSITFTAVATNVNEGGLNNYTVSFSGEGGIHSIAEAANKGLNLDTLKKDLINKEVTVSYLKPGFFSGFHPMATARQITELRIGNEIIYSGFRDSP